MGDMKRVISGTSEPPAEASGDELRRLLHELQVHQIELEMQNLELREAQQVLEATRSRYIDLYDFAPVTYISLDAQACVQEINLTGARFLKVDRARILGMPFAPFVRRDDVRRFFRHVRDCLASGVEQTVDIGLRTAQGDLVDVQLHSTWFLAAAAGQLEPRRLCRTAVVDITATRRAQEALARSHEHYRALLESVPDVVVRLDDAGCFLAIHAPPGVTLPRPRDEFLGRPLTEVLPEALAARASALIQAALQSGRPQQGELELGAGPDERHYEVRVVRSGQREVTAICRDITDLSRMQARLALSERMASLGVLAAGVAHEINNPLTFLVAGLEALRAAASARLLEPQDQGDEITAALAEAEAGAARIRDVVRHLQVFSRPAQETTVPVDLRRALELSVSMARNAINHRARLRVEIGDLPPVLGDESRLGQVFLNLLLNAAQAIPEGAAQRHEVSLRAAARGDRVVVEVGDTGAGIPPAIVGRIFDPFFTTKPVGEGMGLGLAISHRIIASLGGELSVESEVGRGSTFRVELPATAARPPPPPEDEPAPARRLRVLVIDDEPLVGMALHRILRREHDVISEIRAEGALARLRAGERYDLILCDLMMPEMSGERFHGELAGIEPDTRPAVVFMSGGTFTPESRAFLERVPNACIDKPFSLNQLRRVLASVGRGDPAKVVVDGADNG